MEHSKKLEETKLWQVYVDKLGNDHSRIGWTQDVCNAACKHLKAVRDTFKNYTLHDETHVFNVMDVMAGLLGDSIVELTAGEAELLLLVAALHDLGMVYKPEDKDACLKDNYKIKKFYSSHPELQLFDVEDWDEPMQQNYLRWLHPFRINDVLKEKAWRKHFAKCPPEVINENVIITVCRAHGESPAVIRREALDGDLKYLEYKEVDPLFCAIILRLADILDFDDSRAPEILFSYAGRSKKSVQEWKKHMSSMGFKFPNSPSSNDLPYGAKFLDPAIERSARDFLDWIDAELENGRSLLRDANIRWQCFQIPYQVDRKEIEREGYDYGDFRFTMNQEQIMNLLTGENLYSERIVFIRELLQNSIDATLLRAEMDSGFANKLNSNEARIDLWEWYDNKGDLWFRIDDNGTGMTRGMLEKYFLKAGNSYYNSQELKRELNGRSFSSISRFGIGFLSCFLCGKEAYISTTYFNSDKNIREAGIRSAGISIDSKEFGLRLDVTGLNGYYTLRNQAISDNCPKRLPAPPQRVSHPNSLCEKNGYRTMPGTSIVICLDPDKIESNSLLAEAKKWVFFPQMPIYYNGVQLCVTRDDLLSLAKVEQGCEELSLSESDKRVFDDEFPDIKGKYPQIYDTIDLYDAEQESGVSKLKILYFERKIEFPERHDRLQTDLCNYASYNDDLLSYYISQESKKRITINGYDRKTKTFSYNGNRKIYKVLSNCLNKNQDNYYYGWKGITIKMDSSLHFPDWRLMIVIDDEDDGPKLNVNRESLLFFPLKSILSIIVWSEKSHQLHYPIQAFHSFLVTQLKEWRTIINSDYGKLLDISSLNGYKSLKNTLESGDIICLNSEDLYSKPYYNRSFDDVYYSANTFLYLIYLQLHYKIIIDYSNMRYMFYELASIESESPFDLFPIMPFCYGKTDNDKLKFRASYHHMVFAVTADHAFTKWLLENADKLKKYYPIHFGQIVYGIRNYNDTDLIKLICHIKDELSKTSSRYGIDISKCPELTTKDFFDMTEVFW